MGAQHRGTWSVGWKVARRMSNYWFYVCVCVCARARACICKHLCKDICNKALRECLMCHLTEQVRMCHKNTLTFIKPMSVEGCWILHSACYHTAHAVTGEEMRSDRHNDSLWFGSGNGTSQRYMLGVVAVLINLQGVGGETGSSL